MLTLNDNEFEKNSESEDNKKTVDLTNETADTESSPSENETADAESTPSENETADAESTPSENETADVESSPSENETENNTVEALNEKQEKKKEKKQRKAQQRLNLRNSFKTKSFKAGSYTLAVCAIAIAAAVIVNMIAAALPTKYTKLDATADSIYTLGEYTKEIVGKIDTEVTISLVATKGNEDSTIKTLIERYGDMSDKIKIKTVDPEIDLVATGSENALSENSLIIESEKRSKSVAYDSMYSYSEELMQYAYSGYDVSPDVFDGENEITSAIIFVTTNTLPVVYALTGHGETSLSDGVLSYVTKENIEVKNLDLLKNGSIPDNCECLIINASQKDISADEKAMLVKYLEGGGQLFVTTSFESEATPNLDEVLSGYGVERVNGMVMESDSEYCYQYMNYLMPEIQSHEITDAIKNGNYRVYMPSAHGIKKSDSARSTLTITPLLTSSDSSYAKVDINFNSEADAQMKDTDEKGPFSIGCAVSETNGEKETKIVWFSSPYFLDDSFLNYTGNINLLLNSLKWMCGLEENISVVEAKSVSQYNRLEVTDATGYIWSGLFAAVLPLAALITGIVIWARRKKR